jgi:hypothetical protein
VSDGESGDLGLYIGVGVGVFVLLLVIVVVALVIAQRRRKARQKDDIPDLSKVIDGRGRDSEYGSVAAIGTMSSVKPVTNEYGSMAGIATVTEMGASAVRTGTPPGRSSEYSSSAIQPITYGSFPEGGTMS